MRLKVMLVSNTKVYPLTENQYARDHSIPELAGETVLMVELIYTTKDRKPHELHKVNFHRQDMDQEGRRLKNQFIESGQYEIMTQYWQGTTRPLPVPVAYPIPTEIEVNLIKDYMNNKFPNLLANTPYAIEMEIQNRKEINKQQIQQMKESHKVK